MVKFSTVYYTVYTEVHVGAALSGAPEPQDVSLWWCWWGCLQACPLDWEGTWTGDIDMLPFPKLSLCHPSCRVRWHLQAFRKAVCTELALGFQRMGTVKAGLK